MRTKKISRRNQGSKKSQTYTTLRKSIWIILENRGKGSTVEASEQVISRKTSSVKISNYEHFQ